MKILDSNEYINEKLNIRPVSKDRLSKMKEEPSVDEKARQFIEENHFKWNTKTIGYDCEDDVIVSEDIVTDGKLKIRFGKVDGDFICRGNNLTTLEGAPQKVGGDFYCSFNNLTSLEGAPQKVGGHFNCNNNQLTTLEGAPQKVGGHFICNNNQLTSLEGAPQKVGGDFSCRGNNLTTLEGVPNVVCGNFYCGYNQNLVLPKENPSWLKGEIIS